MKPFLYRIFCGALLLAFALGSSGCAPELLYALSKRKAARGEGGPYRQSIQWLLAEDKEYPETAAAGDGHVGRIPSSLEDGSGDERVALTARGLPRKSVKLIFGGVEDGQMCFLHLHREEVINFGEGELKRVDDIGRSYKFVAEFAGPLTSPEVTKRGLEPAPGAAVLDNVETLDAENYTADTGTQYIFVKQRRCAPAPARPEGKPVEWLTVLVTPNNSADDADPYLIAWQILPGEG
jgi:hypothetical protein